MFNRLSLMRARYWAALPAVAVAIALALMAGRFAPADASRSPRRPRPTVVLVHGDWADGSSWNAVTARLIHRGYKVVVPPNPLRGPIEDSVYLRSFLQTIPGPVVLVRTPTVASSPPTPARD